MPRGTTRTPLPINPGGIREDVPIHEVPAGWLRAGSNWLTRNGLGRPRPGYTQVGSTLASANAITGFGFRGTRETAANLYVHTLTKAYEYDGSAFTDRTGTWTTSTNLQPVRMVPYWNGGTFVILRTNVANAVDKAVAGGNFADATGAPAARDITVCSGRVVLGGIATGGTFDQRVQWSNFNTCDAWTATDISEQIDTPGSIIAVKAFGPLSFGVYKDDGVVLGQAQSATAAFQFQFIGDAIGPASPAAVVSAFGTHYWLADDGLIYSFNGSKIDPVGTGLTKSGVQGFSYSNRMAAHGHLLHVAQPEIWWYYPSSTTATNVSAVSLNLVTGAINPHTMSHAITASAQWLAQGDSTYDGLAGTFAGLTSLYPTYDAMTGAALTTAVLGESTGIVDQFGLSVSDRGTAIPWSFTHGWQEPNPGAEFYLDGVESFWKKTSALTVTVGVTVTDSLSDDATTDPETTGTYDLATGSSHFTGLAASNLRGQFVQVRQAAASQVESMEHRMSGIFSWPRGAT